jgi:hypothetical protein
MIVASPKIKPINASFDQPWASRAAASAASIPRLVYFGLFQVRDLGYILSRT